MCAECTTMQGNGSAGCGIPSWITCKANMYRCLRVSTTMVMMMLVMMTKVR